MNNSVTPSDDNLERVSGIVERITFHNPENGWTVLKVSSFRDPGRLITVLIHQAKVFAGATMEFWGTYGHHSQHGEQFKAVRAVEKKPASAAALEKYLGSGLIRGVGPATAKRIVGHFKERTLEVFEKSINELLHVPGIADKKIAQIRTSWSEHQAIRDVMIFLQGYGISTLFATKIYKTYGDKSIQIVSDNPYRLAHDIYGIGFFSADKIALAMGFEKTGKLRIEAGIKHVLSASRDEGHCFLTEEQIVVGTLELLRENIERNNLMEVLLLLKNTNQVKHRKMSYRGSELQDCYYSKSLYYDELTTADRLLDLMKKQVPIDLVRIKGWVAKYCEQQGIELSEEQMTAVCEISAHPFSILTGGPGCGKTTCTKVLVQLLLAMKRRVLLAAPTGRAAQRMSEVIGIEAKTIHRLLEWAPAKAGFKKDETDQLQVDFLIVDETSMLDIGLAASLFKAVPNGAQVLFIGDPDQLPAVGAGDVLADLLKSPEIPRFRLTQVFRQAQSSSIIRFAHEINSGGLPKILSPLAEPQAFAQGIDCLFVDSDEATQEQLRFLSRAKAALERTVAEGETHLLRSGEKWVGRLQKAAQGIEIDELLLPSEVTEQSVREPILMIPEKFRNVDLNQLLHAGAGAAELKTILKSVHPWSSLHYGLTAVDSVVRLYTKSIREWMGGAEVEIQVLTPQVRGTLGTMNLNHCLQAASNPEAPHKRQLQMGGRTLRTGDRVIQTRNNYDLGVFNGDIGRIVEIDTEGGSCHVSFSGGDGRREVVFEREDLNELSLAYAITIHKSQGSEFQVVLIPVLGQHFNMLFRNLIYTGLTRAKKLAVFVGSRKALAMAVNKIDNRKRQTALTGLVSQVIS
ncbi:MAG: AAA family ATPase [Bdellovibrionales bacterium]|nr:AAA family ATPase [Bdellovibrionales bacterium]